MNTLAALENTFRDMRKHGCQTVMVTQSLADFGRYSYKPRPAFQDWIERPEDWRTSGREAVTLLARSLVAAWCSLMNWGEHGQKK
ncbi:hypothetical protein ACJ8B3_00455 [Klebsiella pneumoniae]